MTTLLQLVVSIVSLYFVFKISRDTADIADEGRKKDELAKRIEEFGAMFADVAEKKKKKTKTVSFEAAADDEE